jgi:hypothetical protein
VVETLFPVTDRHFSGRNSPVFQRIVDKKWIKLKTIFK